MVTGKFDEEKTLAHIEKKFGDIAKPSIPLRDSHTVELAQDGEKKVNVNRVGGYSISFSVVPYSRRFRRRRKFDDVPVRHLRPDEL